MKTPADIIRACYTAYETKDRHALEELLADDFTFTSPLDDNISRERYFERCWPNSEHLERFDIQRLFVEGNEAFVQYECQPTLGPSFRNTELFTLKGDKVRHVEVFFGAEDVAQAGEEEIRALIHSTIEACRAKDAATLITHYSSHVVAFDLITPLQYTGTAELEKRAAEWFASFRGPIRYDIQNPNITVSGDTAFCACLNHVAGATTDGKDIDMWWRSTLCCQKLEGRWKITHSHSSVPFDMHSGKAVMDLRP